MIWPVVAEKQSMSMGAGGWFVKSDLTSPIGPSSRMTFSSKMIFSSRNWGLLRISMEFLRENETTWQTRRIEEVDRIK